MAHQLINNTIYQPVGDAVQLVGNSSNVELRNNILWVQNGYDLNVAADSQQGFNSDYNDLYATASGQLVLWGSTTFVQLLDWQYELNFDRHGLSVDPQFVDPAGSDFQILSGSPTVDAGDPASPYLSETAPNGGRVNLGSTGNTDQATPSDSQTVQVLNPLPSAKLQIGQTVDIQWQSSGLTTSSTAALINAGGGQVGNWLANTYQTSGYTSSFNNPVDTSGVTNPRRRRSIRRLPMPAVARGVSWPMPCRPPMAPTRCDSTSQLSTTTPVPSTS